MIRIEIWTQTEFRFELGVSLAGLKYDQELQMVQREREREGGEEGREKQRKT